MMALRANMVYCRIHCLSEESDGEEVPKRVCY